MGSVRRGHLTARASPVGGLGRPPIVASTTIRGVRRKPQRRKMVGGAFPPLSDAELGRFLRDLAGLLPDDLAAAVTGELDRGDHPGTVAQRVRDELRRRGELPG